MMTWNTLFLLLTACELSGPSPEGLLPTPAGSGPQVIWDIEAEDLPDLPLPNDAATRLDATSPTGRRVNISEDAPTEVERRVRRGFNELDGFGSFAPIMVSFDAPLDVEDLIARHGADPDFRNDALYVLNVSPDCERFGEEVAVDIGGGYYPMTHYNRGDRWEDPEAPLGYGMSSRGSFSLFDHHADSNNLLFEDHLEDRDRDGVMDPGEDVDFDGLLDLPNFLDPYACAEETEGSREHDRCVADNLLTFYERESHTLILRPLWPLEQGCSYAVALTDRLRGEDGEPVRSPFPWINSKDQTPALQPLPGLIARYGLGVENLTFAWSFTVGHDTAPLETLREGLYGSGPMARLQDEFPVSSFHPWTRGELHDIEGWEVDPEIEDDILLPGSCVGPAVTWMWSKALGEWEANLCSLEADLAAMGGLFGGTFLSPNLMVDKDGQANEAYPADLDERWDIDPVSGEATYGETEVTFWCSLPVERETSCSPGNPEGMPFCKPYPVILYGHGYGGARSEITLHMGRHNAQGYALCSMDYYGHGLNAWRQDPEAGLGLYYAYSEFVELGVPDLLTLTTLGRDRDLNNDGVADPGADMWTADPLHTRDMVRQAALDTQQFVRILRSMDGESLDDHGNILGDLDGDGEVDIGGPENILGAWGISLGGIVSGVVAGAEPSLDAVSPNAGGAGLTDIAARSTQAGVPEAVILPMLGPFVGGCIPADEHQNALPLGEETDRDCADGRAQREGPYRGGDLRLMMLAQDNASFRNLEFGIVEGVQPGDRLVLENLNNGETKTSYINERGWFRLSVASDALDPVTRRSLIGLEDDDFGEGSADDNSLLADPWRLSIYEGDSEVLREVVETFEEEVRFQGTIYPAGSTLVPLHEGLGQERNSPDYRRFIALAQSGLSAADPGAWGVRVRAQPHDLSYDPYASGGETRVLMMPTAGDAQVPVNTGVAMARTAGTLGSWMRDPDIPAEYGWRQLFVPDERLGRSPDRYLVDTFVVEGDHRLQRYADQNPINPDVLFDIDNVSDGEAEFSCGDSDWSGMNGENECPDEYDGQEVFFPVPHPPAGMELRHKLAHPEGGYDALRVPVLRPAGQHGIYNAQAFRVFDSDAFMVNFTIRYLGSGGMRLEHEGGCDCVSSTIPELALAGESYFPALSETCTESDLKVCSESCAEAWGLVTPEQVECVP